MNKIKNCFHYIKDIFLPKYSKNSKVFCDNTNNGVAKYSGEIDKLISVVPSERQLAHSNLEYYNFIHFGINTVYNKEWGDGKEDITIFNPKNLDTDKWCKIFASSGSKGVILTAKHHDGFCLFPSKYTHHSIEYSSYKNGKGDIVKELSDSCAKYGLKFGIYLSPWDRHEPTYGKKIYNDYYINQLKELLGGKYGKIFCLWCDGARGKDAILDDDFDYDWNRIYSTVRALQPDCVIAIMGEDVRWIGNEGAKTRKEEWSVVPKKQFDTQAIGDNSQNSENQGEKMKKFDEMSDDLGSRKAINGIKELMWYPAEADVSIRKGWFYHDSECPKSVSQLMKIYYNTVGKNASLLLNIPPNKNGEIADKDARILAEFGESINDIYANQIDCDISLASLNSERKIPKQLENIKLDDSENIIDISFGKTEKVSNIVIKEDIRYSQRVEKFDVYLLLDSGKYLLKEKCTVIGSKRIIPIMGKKVCKGVRIVIKQSRNNPIIKEIKLYK